MEVRWEAGKAPTLRVRKVHWWIWNKLLLLIPHVGECVFAGAHRSFQAVQVKARCLSLCFKVVDSNGEFFLKSSELFESPVYLEEVADVLCILQAGTKPLAYLFYLFHSNPVEQQFAYSEVLDDWSQPDVIHLYAPQSCPLYSLLWTLQRLFFMSVTETGFCVCWLLMSLTASVKVSLHFPLSGDEGAIYQ